MTVGLKETSFAVDLFPEISKERRRNRLTLTVTTREIIANLNMPAGHLYAQL